MAAGLGLLASRDTLLRLVRGLPLHIDDTPRVLGVDDWSIRKSQTYGTILVDLELHKVVDLLPDRDAARLAAWLMGHPGVEVVTRDRYGAYADGIGRGASQAVRVADRFHLVENVRRALQLVVERHRPREEAASPYVPAPELTRLGHGLAKVEREKAVSRERKLDLYRRAVELSQQGLGARSIGAELGMSANTARRYLQAESFPERKQRRTKMDAYGEHAERLWRQGWNFPDIYKELQYLGYTGSRSGVRGTSSTSRRDYHRRGPHLRGDGARPRHWSCRG